MKKFFLFVAAAVAVVGFSVSTVMARGGGHGGGGHGGGHHGGAHHSGAHHNGHHANQHHANHHQNSHYHHSHWAHHNRPFSHGWYGRHGGHWGYGWGGWGWGNPWAVATLGGAAAWLGAEDLSSGWGNYGYVEPQNVLTSDNDADDNDAEDNANDGEQTPINENAEGAQEPAAQAAAAATLASSGQNDPPKQTSFLPLGVFTLAPQGQTEASALVQLALSKDGAVRGTYYDLLSDRDQQIRGAVDKKTGRVAFTFGQQGKVTFETTLGNLTEKKGSVGVHYENGKKSLWTLARYEKEPTEEAKEGGANQADAKNPAEIPVEVEPDATPATSAQQ